MRKIYLKIALFLLFSGFLGAQPFPSLETSPKAAEYAQRITDGNTNWRDLSEAALWASSVNAGPGEEEKAARYMEKISAAVKDLASADIPGDPKARGDYVLDFLHKRFLKSYSARQTRVDEIFISGRYNCVSSAVLYMVLGISAGLDVTGVVTKDHAFAVVNIGGERIDVETTNRYGFDPGNRKEFQDAFGTTTGFAYVPAKNYRDRAAINRIELISLILSNRISALEQANRFTEAIPLALNRMVFLSNDENTADSAEAAQGKADLYEYPEQTIMNHLVNLGAHFVRTGKEDDAIAWAVYANERFPDSERWQDLIKTAAHNKVVKLLMAKKITDAYSALATAKPSLNTANYLEMETMVIEADATEKVNNIRNPGDVKTALDFLANAGGRLPPGRREEMQTAAIIGEAGRLGRAKNLTGSIQWLQDAIKQYGSTPKLETALETQRQNRIGELHNEFAALFNKKQYAQAKASIQKSLQEFPDEKQLLRDLELVDLALP